MTFVLPSYSYSLALLSGLVLFLMSVVSLVSQTLVSQNDRSDSTPLSLRTGETKVVFNDAFVWLKADVKNSDNEPLKGRLRYSWKQIEGPSPAMINTQDESLIRVSGLNKGTYVFQVDVTTDGTLKQFGSVSGSISVVKRDGSSGTVIPASNLSFVYVGRTLKTIGGEAILGWPGNSIHAVFEGTTVRVLLKDGPGTPVNWYAVIDGQDSKPVVLEGDGRTDYLVAEGLTRGRHTLELFRLTGAWAAETTFSGLILSQDGVMCDPPAQAQRRIEFYGDSITEGSYMGDQPFSNNYLSFASVAARLLKADATQICRGGIGLVKGFALPLTLPIIYDRTLMGKENLKWEFSKWVPQVVVINILQNDKWTGADVELTQKAYIELIRNIRSKYPKAFIVCALGGMDTVAAESNWPGYVQSVVNKVKLHDSHIEFFAFDFIGGTEHPTSLEARDMADQLVLFLNKKGESLWNN